jgi:hypothetical protein
MINFELHKDEIFLVVQIIDSNQFTRLDKFGKIRFVYDIMYNNKQKLLSAGPSCHEAIQRGEKFWRFI